MKKLTIANVILLFLLLTGCATTAPTIRILDPEKYSAEGTEFTDRGTVYVFRGTSMAGALCAFAVLLDEKELGFIRRENYLAFPVTNGSHQITVASTSICSTPDIKIDADFAAGKSYYFLVEPNVTFGHNTVTSSSSIAQIDASYAKRLLQTYSPGKSSK